MINKIFPRKLNAATDSRLRQATDMIDAMNVSVTEDFNSEGGDLGGDVGVLKPMKGNEVIENFDIIFEFPLPPYLEEIVGPEGEVNTGEYLVNFHYQYGTVAQIGNAIAAGPVFFTEASGFANWEQLAEQYPNGVYETIGPTGESLGYLAVEQFLSPNNPEDILTINGFELTNLSPVPEGFVESITESEQRVLGSVTDDVLGVIFFFVWADNLNQQGVYAYDRDGILPGASGTPNKFRKVLSTSSFNFDSTGFVKGDVVHIGKKTEGYDKTVMLYFTDNKNEPRKIDVFRVMSSNLITYNSSEFTDLITACPKTPLYPLEFSFWADAERNVSNFTRIPGMQFAYQYIYKGGVESAISTYSKLALSYEYTAGGVNVPVNLSQNVCRLELNISEEAGFNREIERVRFLVRFGDVGVFKVIDEVERASLSPGAGGEPFYNFYNDKVLLPVLNEEQNKLFTNLPRVAQAQAIASDRLFYGNYIEGYDELDSVDANITAIYQERPDAEFDLELKLDPFLAMAKSHSQQNLYGRNKVAGYRLNTSAFPSSIEKNSLINIYFSVSPAGNFHIYDQTKSFHGSGQVGLSSYNYTSPDTQASQSVDGVYNYMSGKAYFGDNEGVCPQISSLGSGLKWQYRNVDGSIFTRPAAYGTSAANPFILAAPETPLSYSLQILVTDVIEGDASEVLKNNIAYFLTGYSTTLDDDGNPIQPDADLITLIDSQVESTYNINLGINSGSSISVASGSDYRKNLIVGVKDATDNNVENQNPIGYFIVNKADVTVGLKRLPTSDLVNPSDSAFENGDLIIGLDLKGIENEDVKTVIPYMRRVGFRGSTPTELYEDPDDIGYDKNVYPKAGLFGNFNADSLASNFVTSSYNAPDAIYENLCIHSFRCWSRQAIAQDTWLPFRQGETWYTGGDGTNYLAVTEQNGKYIYTNVLWEGIHGGTATHPPSEFFFMYYLPQDEPGGAGEDVLDFLFGESDYAKVVKCTEHTYLAQDAWRTTLQRANRIKVEGWLSPVGANTNAGYNDSLKLIVTPQERIDAGEIEGESALSDAMLSSWSFVDGEGDFSGHKYAYNNALTGSITGQIVFTGHIRGYICHKKFNYGQHMLPGNNVNPEVNQLGTSSTSIYSLGNVEERLWNEPFLKFMETGINNPEESVVNTNFALDIGDTNYPALTFTGTSTGLYENWVEIMASTTEAFLGGAADDFRTFKTKANHEFGVVYYDQRGRPGNVNYLGNLYVAGYSSMDIGRGDNKGRVEVEIELNHDPPEWATDYQIVYAGNTTVGDFRQYTVGSAFLNLHESPGEGDEQDGIIFVSLALLQGANGISYTDAYGAVNELGTQDMYVHTIGDKLRIISYFEDDGETLVYPNNYEFDIVGVREFNESPSENPFYNVTDAGDNESGGATPGVHPAKVGQFLMLRNNFFAAGFTYSDVLAAETSGGYEGESNEHKWNNRTLVEIYSPVVDKDVDERVYYEIAETYPIESTTIDDVTTYSHSQPLVTLRQGDVYWRRIPLNFAPYNTTEGLFESIPQPENQQANFVSWWVESLTFTDLFPGANVNSFGKPKIVMPNSEEIRRRASIIYSDKNNYASPINRFSSFNGYLANFKDIPNNYGAINYLLDDYESIFVIQESKCSKLPTSRNILSTAEGDESVTTSTDILGTQKFYAGDYGADNNPESVVRAGDNIYFASKSAKEVYKFAPSSGISVISNTGMKKFFNTLFSEGLKDIQVNPNLVLKVVGGFDPLNDEFLISVYTIGKGSINSYFEVDPTEATTTILLEQEISDLQNQVITLINENNSLTASNENLLEQLQGFNEGGSMFINAQRFKEIYHEVGPALSGDIPEDVNVGEGVEDSGFNYQMVGLDTNNDGVINVSDLLSLLTVYGSVLPLIEPSNPVVTISTTDALGAFVEGDTPDDQVQITNIDNLA